MRNRQTFCTNVKEALKVRGLHFSDLSELTGISYQRLLRLAKNAEQNPGLYDAQLIADALGVDLLFLMTENEEAA